MKSPRRRSSDRARRILTAVRRYHHRMNQPWVVLREPWGIDAFALCQAHGQREPYYRRVAYEIKVDRGDFRKELDAWPRKAHHALELAHAFVFVVPEGLLRPEELTRDRSSQLRLAGKPRRNPLWVPHPAGLMEVAEDGTCKMRLRPTFGTPRAFTDKEVSYLAAYAYRPAVIYGAEQARLDANYAKVELERAIESANKMYEDARQVLRRLGVTLVQPDSRWVVPAGWVPPVAVYGPDRPRVQWDGQWSGRPNMQPLYSDVPMECDVVRVEHDEVYGVRVLLRRVDTGDEHGGGRFDGVRLDEFLLCCERVEQPGQIVDLAARRQA